MTDSTAGEYSAAVGENIRRARNKAGLSLTDMAAKSGDAFSAPAMRSWEAGERGIRVDRLKQVADILGRPPASLLPAEPGDDKPLVLTEDMVDLLIAVGDALRAQRRSRYTLLTVDEPGGPQGGAP